MNRPKRQPTNRSISWTLGRQQLSALPLAFSLLLPLYGGRPVRAQAKAPFPVLHRRTYNQGADELDTGTRSSGRTNLPLDASGAYALGSSASIDVELQPDRLSGFITRPGDRESDEGTPLTFFFATGHLAGQALAFTTRQVHGIWFSFEGTILRGSSSRDGRGSYVLEGRLTLHDATSQTEQSRMVSLPLQR